MHHILPITDFHHSTWNWCQFLEDIVTDFEWCLIGYHHFYQRLPFMYRLLSFPVSTCYIKLIRSEIAATEKWRPTDRPPTLKNKQTNKQKKQNEKKNSVKKRGQMRKKKKVLNGARGTMTRAGRSHRRQSIGRLIDRSIDASTANHGEGWAGGWAGQGCACGPSVCQPMVSTGLALISQS